MRNGKRKIRVGILGHWGGNIGHEVMALGVKTLLEATFSEYEGIPIEQHRPLDIYSVWNPLRHIPTFRHNRGGILSKQVKSLINTDTISRCLWPMSWVRQLDLGVACGGPLIRPGISKGDLNLMYEHMHGAFTTNHVPVLNLSVGSCFPWESMSSSEMPGPCKNLLKKIFQKSTASTVRDKLAQEVCHDIGEYPELIGDTGFLAGSQFAKALSISDQNKPKYVVINYQRLGANEDWGQQVDPNHWRRIISELIQRLSERHPVVFLCHDRNEYELSKTIEAAIPRIQPTSVKEYAELISGALVGMGNRIHACIALASAGVPVYGVGTDSRLGTLETIGIQTNYVKNVTVDMLESTLETLIQQRQKEEERLKAQHQKSLRQYKEIILGFLHKAQTE